MKTFTVECYINEEETELYLVKAINADAAEAKVIKHEIENGNVDLVKNPDYFQIHNIIDIEDILAKDEVKLILEI